MTWVWVWASRKVRRTKRWMPVWRPLVAVRVHSIKRRAMLLSSLTTQGLVGLLVAFGHLAGGKVF